jgi:hypothetical protein|tara:strand:+ start:28 stop:165 length:138 start_codon:yes stop_codon:yes gene_type:complete
MKGKVHQNRNRCIKCKEKLVYEQVDTLEYLTECCGIDYKIEEELK